MVPPDSHGISRAPCYLGTMHRSRRLASTGVPPSTPGHSMPFDFNDDFLLLASSAELASTAPQPRLRNPCRVSHARGLASSAFARHYSRNHQCFLFLRVLRCFTSPRSPSHPIYSGMSNPTSLGLGFPIRTPSDHSSFDNSPRTIAAYHVLHRPLVPRHPPSALHNFNKNVQTRTTVDTVSRSRRKQDARVHYAHLNQQPTTTHTRTPNPATTGGMPPRWQSTSF